MKISVLVRVAKTGLAVLSVGLQIYYLWRKNPGYSRDVPPYRPKYKNDTRFH